MVLLAKSGCFGQHVQEALGHGATRCQSGTCRKSVYTASVLTIVLLQEYKQKGVEEKARREKENEAKEADGPPAVRKQPKPRPVNRK